MHTVDLTTGNAIFNSNPGISVGDLEYNYMDSTLYGVSIDDGNDYLVKIDPATGKYAMISSSPVGQTLNPGISTIDPVNKHLFFCSSDEIITVDIITGNPVYRVKKSFNLGLLEFEKLCPPLPPQKPPYENTAMAFPNPVENTLHLKTTEYPVNFVLYNNLCSPIINTTITNSEVDLSLLGQGVYMYNVFDKDGKLIQKGKLIKAK